MLQNILVILIQLIVLKLGCLIKLKTNVISAQIIIQQVKKMEKILNLIAQIPVVHVMTIFRDVIKILKYVKTILHQIMMKIFAWHVILQMVIIGINNTHSAIIVLSLILVRYLIVMYVMLRSVLNTNAIMKQFKFLTILELNVKHVIQYFVKQVIVLQIH